MLNKLEKYYEDGLVYKQVHPTLPLTIWNYSEKVQFERLWDEVLVQVRGLVTDELGNIIAKPFPKFFNIEEEMHTPTSEFEVYEKMDGSLGILMHYEGEWILATRGSFTSDQAIKGTEILNNYRLTLLNDKDVYEIIKTNTYDITYLFEIIYPQNQIVVKYDYEDLVLLGAINRSTGEELSYDKLERIADMIKCPLVKKYDNKTDFKVLKENIEPNREGYVVRFSNGDRMKIKGSDYIALHKIMTNVSTTTIWEHLSAGLDLNDVYKSVPDEFYNRIKEYVNELKLKYLHIENSVDFMLRELTLKDRFNRVDISLLFDRKIYAKWVQEQPKKYWGILFKIYDGKKYDDIIWKIIKPEYQKL